MMKDNRYMFFIRIKLASIPSLSFGVDKIKNMKDSSIMIANL